MLRPRFDRASVKATVVCPTWVNSAHERLEAVVKSGKKHRTNSTSGMSLVFVACTRPARRQRLRRRPIFRGKLFEGHGIQPNPARDPRIKLPREDKRELTPPTAQHVLAGYALLPRAYRLPLLVLDATGMRIGELEGLSSMRPR